MPDYSPLPHYFCLGAFHSAFHRLRCLRAFRTDSNVATAVEITVFATANAAIEPLEKSIAAVEGVATTETVPKEEAFKILNEVWALGSKRMYGTLCQTL